MLPKHNRGFWFLFAIYVTAFIVDIWTTLSVEAHSVLESNLLYTWTGSFVPIILLNLLLAGGMVWLYITQRSSPSTRFSTIVLMCVIIFARISAIKNAVAWIKNPITIEEAKVVVTQAMKNESTIWIYVITLAPVILSMVSFYFWKKDHHIWRKDIKKIKKTIP